MTAKEWISVDPQELDTVQSHTENGVEINIGLSPYQIPEGVRGYYDEELERFVIELKYLDDDEELERVWDAHHISLFAGKGSHCLYEIHVDVKSLDVNAVSLKLSTKKVEDEIRRMAEDNRFAKMRRHYHAVNEAIGKVESQLVGAE